MELTLEQVRRVRVLSDTVLYPEAVAFVKHLVEERDCNPLPSSQVVGLLGIAQANSYRELHDFVVHQRDRNWQPSKQDIKRFYFELERRLADMRLRVRKEFRLVSDSLNAGAMNQMVDVLMAPLARDFIQHIVAENNRRAAYMSRRR